MAPGKHAVLVVDQAGWHLSAGLVVPDNITLVLLPPKWTPRKTLASATADPICFALEGGGGDGGTAWVLRRDERLRALSAAGDPGAAQAVVDFESFRPELETALARADRSRGGRPPYDAVLMFRIWYCRRSTRCPMIRPSISSVTTEASGSGRRRPRVGGCFCEGIRGSASSRVPGTGR